MTCMFKAPMNGEERDVHPRFLHVHPKTPLLIREGGGFGYAKIKFPPNLGGNMECNYLLLLSSQLAIFEVHGGARRSIFGNTTVPTTVLPLFMLRM